jgi:flagellar biosynthesis regulator FlbT
MWFVVKIRKDDLDYDGRSLKYIPPLDWIYFAESEIFSPDITNFKRYLLCLYYGVLILGLNEMGPVNTEEMLYFSVVLMMSAIMNSLIFSDLIMLIDELSKRSALY